MTFTHFLPGTFWHEKFGDLFLLTPSRKIRFVFFCSPPLFFNFQTEIPSFSRSVTRKSFFLLTTQKIFSEIKPSPPLTRSVANFFFNSQVFFGDRISLIQELKSLVLVAKILSKSNSQTPFYSLRQINQFFFGFHSVLKLSLFDESLHF